MPYEKRYFAFVDILGFSELISSLDRGETATEEICQLLATVHNARAADGHIIPGSDFRAQSISDAVAISAADNENGLLHVLDALKELTFGLLERGFFVRGALLRGPLYHCEKMVFGRALLEAYHLESKIAKFPRVMVTRDVLRELESARKRSVELKTYIDRAIDGPSFVNPLQGIDQSTKDARRKHLLPRLQNIAEKITHRLDEASDNPNHFEKVQWFGRYWNNKIPDWAIENCTVAGPGVDREKELVTKGEAMAIALALS